MSTNPYEASQRENEILTKSEPRSSFPSCLVIVLIFLLAPVGLYYYILYSVGAFYYKMKDARCGANMRQIAVGLQLYHDTYQAFPPAYTVDAAGKPLHSWRTLILPQLEQKELYDTIDLTKPWDDPANAHAREETHYPYNCLLHSYAMREKGFTTYLASVGPRAAFDAAKPRTRSDIKDNPSTTLMVIEVPTDHAVHWMSPQDADASLILSINRQSKLAHRKTKTMAAVFADGSTKILKATVPAEKRRGMISIDGGEKVKLD